MKLTNEEWNELVTLKNEISLYLTSINSTEMERFTELMVKSIEGRGNYPHNFTNTPTNY